MANERKTGSDFRFEATIKPGEDPIVASLVPNHVGRLSPTSGRKMAKVEDGFEAAKGEFGMDDYEVRKWIAWHRHITLCLLAHAFVGVLRSEEVRKWGTPEDLLPLTLPEVRRLLCSLLLAKLPEERAVLS